MCYLVHCHPVHTHNWNIHGEKRIKNGCSTHIYCMSMMGFWILAHDHTEGICAFFLHYWTNRIHCRSIALPLYVPHDRILGTCVIWNGSCCHILGISGPVDRIPPQTHNFCTSNVSVSVRKVRTGHVWNATCRQNTVVCSQTFRNDRTLAFQTCLSVSCSWSTL